MRKIRTAIVGPGKVAHLHAKGINQCEHAELVGVCGRSMDRSQEFARVHDTQAYESLSEMLERAEVELLLVCTPHMYHRESVVVAAEAGVHCLIEKPMASTLEDCDAMLAAAKKGGAKLGVISQRRFYEPIVRMKEALDAGKIGTPVLAHVIMMGWRDEAYYNSDPWRGKWSTEGGGVLINQAPHQLDLFHWLMGPIKRLYGVARNLNHPYIEVEDTAVATVEFEGGALGNILLSNSQKPGIHGKIHIHGSNAASIGAQTEGGSMFIAGRTSIQEPPFNDLWTVPGEEGLLSQWKAADEEHFTKIDATVYYIGLQIEDFCKAIKEERAPLSTGEEGRRTVELITAFYTSTRQSSPVSFPVDGDEITSRKITSL